MADFINDNPALEVISISGYPGSGLPTSKAGGPLASLYNNTRKISKMQYPIDLSSGPYVHWIQFNILESVGMSTDGLGGVANQNGRAGLPSVSSFVNTNLASATNFVSSQLGQTGSDSLNKFLGFNSSNPLSLQRRVRATNKMIALYMPNQVVFNQNNQYSDMSLTQQLGLALQGIQAGQDASGTGGVGANLAEVGGKLATGDTNLGIFMATGLVLNPQFEVIFQQTGLRTFQFEFVLSARSKSESDAIAEIIKTFRMAAAPSVAGTSGRYLIPPDEFDISFYFNGGQSNIIPRISTCVLTDIITDLAPSGQWSTFADGRPLATRMTLQFKEVEMITKDLVDKGF